MARRALNARGELLEDAFTGHVIALARVYGWRVAHFRPAQTAHGYRTAVQGDGAGFPDLVMVRAPRLVFAELKTDRGRIAPDQRAWLEALATVGDAVDRAAAPARRSGGHPAAAVEVYAWRPRDWEAVQAALRPAGAERRVDWDPVAGS